LTRSTRIENPPSQRSKARVEEFVLTAGIEERERVDLDAWEMVREEEEEATWLRVVPLPALRQTGATLSASVGSAVLSSSTYSQATRKRFLWLQIINWICHYDAGCCCWWIEMPF
jgi:hypothetical protein